MVKRKHIAAGVLFAAAAASAAPVLPLPEAHVVGLDAYMECSGKPVKITAEEYTALAPPLPTGCSKAYADFVYDTPSGKPEIGFYRQAASKFAYMTDERVQTATGTITRTVEKYTDSIPTESIISRLIP